MHKCVIRPIRYHFQGVNPILHIYMYVHENSIKAVLHTDFNHHRIITHRSSNLNIVDVFRILSTNRTSKPSGETNPMSIQAAEHQKEEK